MSIAGRMTPRPVHPRTPQNQAGAGSPGLPCSAAPAPSPSTPKLLHEAQPRHCTPGSYHSEAGAGPATSPFRTGAEEDAHPLLFPLSPEAR
ncbi:hypothetical protein HispidOSU_005434, partial [Sigmodon hispidus]